MNRATLMALVGGAIGITAAEVVFAPVRGAIWRRQRARYLNKQYRWR